MRVLEYQQVRELLLACTASGLGAGLARQLRPLTDARRIGQLLAETGELKRLLQPDRSLPLGGMHDLSPLLDRLDQGEEIFNIDEILYIGETLVACRGIKGYFTEVDESYPHLCRFDRDIDIYPELESRIRRTFGDGATILNSASAHLAATRKEIKIVRGRIQAKLHSVLRSASSYLQDTGIRERGGRPVIAIKAQFASRVSGLSRGKSDSGTTVFIEPEAVRQLGDELKAAADEEKAEMSRILRELTALIADCGDSLRRTLAVLAHIDLTFAKVRLSRDFDMHPPQLNTRGLIRLEQARHPLLLALASQSDDATRVDVVPIDVRLGEDFHTLIITGPNTGGKTITLKTIGLLCLMAQSGMHIPAGVDSTVPVFSQIAADIGDEQSIEQSLSTFSSHLINIAAMLEDAGENSLILLDELGGGTDPVEGAALARSILSFLHARGARTAVTTHISQLKTLGYTVQGYENASIEFDVETLAPTHRLLIGVPGNSNALAIARRLGLPDEVIENAACDPNEQDGGESTELIEQLQVIKKTAAEDRRQVEESRVAGERLEAEWRLKADELDEREKRLSESLARTDPRAQLNYVREEVDRLRRGEGSRQALLQSLRKLSTWLTQQLRAPADPEKPMAAKPALKPGDRVYVRSLDKVGVLNEIDGRRAQVQLGSLPMTVTLDDIDAHDRETG